MIFYSKNSVNCRPKVNENKVCINIEQGQHPVIQQILQGSQQFVPNDTNISVSISTLCA